MTEAILAAHVLVTLEEGITEGEDGLHLGHMMEAEQNRHTSVLDFIFHLPSRCCDLTPALCTVTSAQLSTPRPVIQTPRELFFQARGVRHKVG